MPDTLHPARTGLTLGQQVAFAHASLRHSREAQQSERDLSLLRALLGHRDGDTPCSARQHPQIGRVCLLPARHVAEGRPHKGLGASWATATPTDCIDLLYEVRSRIDTCMSDDETNTTTARAWRGISDLIRSLEAGPVVHEPLDEPGGLTPCCAKTGAQIEREGGLWADGPTDVVTCNYETEG